MKNLAILLMLSIVFAACNAMGGKHKFFMQTPAGWHRTDTVEESGDTLIRLDSPADDVADINANLSLLIMRSFSPDAFMEASIKDVKSRAETFEETGRGKRDIDGVSSKWIQYSVKYKRVKTLVDQRVFFMPKDGYVYMFFYTAPKDHLPDFKPNVDEVLNSFKILD